MKNSEWREQFLGAVAGSSNEGKEAVDYIRARKTHVGIRRARIDDPIRWKKLWGKLAAALPDPQGNWTLAYTKKS
jgi:hypothetical protein